MNRTQEELRFGNLCKADKLRLQQLIKELATSSKLLSEKDSKIEQLELDLKNKKNEQSQIEHERIVALTKAEGAKEMYSKFKNELFDQQADIQRQIKKATQQIETIKSKRKNERNQFKINENLLKQEIEHHIETARSTENKADQIQKELEIMKMKEKIDSQAQTSFTTEDKTNSAHHPCGLIRTPSPVLGLAEIKRFIKTRSPSPDTCSKKIVAEQKKLEKLLKQQGKLLEEAAHYREEMKLKLDLLTDHESVSGSSTTDEHPTITTNSLASPKFYDLPTPRSPETTISASQKHRSRSDKSKKSAKKSNVLKSDKENLAKLIDEINDGIGDFQHTPRDHSIIRLVDLIDQLELTRLEPNFENTVSEMSSLSSVSPSQPEFDPVIEDLFFRK